VNQQEPVDDDKKKAETATSSRSAETGERVNSLNDHSEESQQSELRAVPVDTEAVASPQGPVPDATVATKSSEDNAIPTSTSASAQEQSTVAQEDGKDGATDEMMNRELTENLSNLQGERAILVEKGQSTDAIDGDIEFAKRLLGDDATAPAHADRTSNADPQSSHDSTQSDQRADGQGQPRGATGSII
jgi:hypothetical protein